MYTCGAEQQYRVALFIVYIFQAVYTSTSSLLDFTSTGRDVTVAATRGFFSI